MTMLGGNGQVSDQHKKTVNSELQDCVPLEAVHLMLSSSAPGSLTPCHQAAFDEECSKEH